MQGVPKASAAPVQRVNRHIHEYDMAVAEPRRRAEIDAAATSSRRADRRTAWQSIATIRPRSRTNNRLSFTTASSTPLGTSRPADGDTNALYSYDPTAWNVDGAAPAPRDTAGGPAHGFIGGRLYVAGGWSSAFRPTRTAIQRSTNPAEQHVRPRVPIGSGALARIGSAVLGSKLYVVGRLHVHLAARRACVSVLDALTGACSKVAPYPEPTSWLGCGAIRRQNLLAPPCDWPPMKQRSTLSPVERARTERSGMSANLSRSCWSDW